eukprot:TRINITY_DN24884_c0_g1_i1.p1 TRINITY_DN24884_c0_g1~~TRINITY_DN24884_c0_g1_i1.p1  ORF type:complete len:408 (-),score=68.09 TRINITY_DN24884_c0_g1_i1:71-1150(-)
MAPKVLILNPSAEESAGIVGSALSDEGATVEELATQESVDLLVSGESSPSVRVVPALPADSRDYDFLVILGSPLGVLTAGRDKGISSRCPTAGDPQTPAKTVAAIEALVRDFTAQNKPVLGLCLGAQLVARSFGGSVFKLPRDVAHTALPVRVEGKDEEQLGVEFGWHTQEFTEEAENDHVVGTALRAWRSGLPDDSSGTDGGCTSRPATKFQQWHSDTFTLPHDACALSSSPACKAQAFRVGTWTYAFQYHIEVDEQMAKDWSEEFIEGNDSYAEKEAWACAVKSERAAAMRAALASVIAEGSIARAELFTRSVVHSLLLRAAAVRREQNTKKAAPLAAIAVASVAVLAVFVLRSRRK